MRVRACTARCNRCRGSAVQVSAKRVVRGREARGQAGAAFTKHSFIGLAVCYVLRFPARTQPLYRLNGPTQLPRLVGRDLSVHARTRRATDGLPCAMNPTVHEPVVALEAARRPAERLCACAEVSANCAWCERESRMARAVADGNSLAK